VSKAGPGFAVTAPFPAAARIALRDLQLRANVAHASDVIQGKRRNVVEEMPDWQELREAGSEIRRHTFLHLDHYLEQFELNCERAGGVVHWARTADEAQSIVLKLAQEAGASEVIKIKSMTTEEIGLNTVLEAAGIRAYETDLAELILQLGHDQPSHLVVPALHKNRHQVRELFQREMNLPDLGDKPADLAEAARMFLRQKFLRVKTAVSGANFLIADSGGVCIVESEGNGRMCLTLPDTLITIAGIDKIIPRFVDLEVFLQVLPRSATGERMNPYNSIWTGVHAGDGPKKFHIVLLDNGRSAILGSGEALASTLNCIRCGACQNACPVYRQTGGHSYGSVYGGPIGAILTPQLIRTEHSASLPYASTLCGACYEVCPVKINIPDILLELRSEVVRRKVAGLGQFTPEPLAMKALAMIFRSGRRFSAAQRLGRSAQAPFLRPDKDGSEWIKQLPVPLQVWTEARDLRAMPAQTFRQWWAKRSVPGRRASGDAVGS
jgi:L-lactate dehydrogenase complex protein LldF